MTCPDCPGPPHLAYCPSYGDETATAPFARVDANGEIQLPAASGVSSSELSDKTASQGFAPTRPTSPVLAGLRELRVATDDWDLGAIE
jgi:hypothetical protein